MKKRGGKKAVLTDSGIITPKLKKQGERNEKKRKGRYFETRLQEFTERIKEDRRKERWHPNLAK